MVVFSFLFMDLFDTLGTLVSLLYKGGFVKDGKMPRMKESFFADAVGTTIGACMGTSAISTYVESAAGVSVGGNVRINGFVIAVCFFLSSFLCTLFLSIPGTGHCPGLDIGRFLMISALRKLTWMIMRKPFRHLSASSRFRLRTALQTASSLDF